ncbi:MAG: glucose-6-phosphate isomerase family protein [Terriglobia bacterium]
MSFDPGIDVRVTERPMGFQFGPDVFGPTPEYRSLDSIRPSLYDPASDGPDPVYAIAMDVGKREHQPELEKRYLLFGVVTYAAGRLGNEPVRSQGHVHRVSAHSGWSPPEVYEIWRGRGIVYMQEFADDDPGRCFAVVGEPGDVIVVPPGWAHATISADPQTPLTFAAWCDREYGFVYDNVRARCGLAWYALLDDGGQLKWHRNTHYIPRDLAIGPPLDYRELGLAKGTPIYSQFERRPAAIQWVSDPLLRKENWAYFTPCRTEVH